MPSSIYAAIDYLDNALATKASDPSSDLYQVDTGPGHPKFGTQEKEFLRLIRWGSIATEDVVLGVDQQEEQYALTYRGYAWKPELNGTREELKELVQRVLQLYEVLRGIVQADRTLGGAVNLGATVAAAREDESEDTPVQVLDEETGQSTGWYAHADMRVLCRARIT